MKHLILIIILLFSLFSIQPLKATNDFCIYEDTISCGNLFAMNEQVYAMVDRSRFPELIIGREYRIVMEYLLGDSVQFRDSCYATYTCNLYSQEDQEWMGYIDYGTLMNWDASMGFQYINGAESINPDDFSNDDDESPNLYDYMRTLTFHFEYSGQLDNAETSHGIPNVRIFVYE